MYKDKEKQRAFQRYWQRKLILGRKIKVVEMLGGKCVRCGYKENIHALQLDHIQLVRRKTEDRKTTSQTTGSNLWKNIANGIIKNPTGLVQLLCANCHFIKTYEEDRKTYKNYNQEIFTPTRPRFTRNKTTDLSVSGV